MSNVSKINGYDIKDKQARNSIDVEITNRTNADNNLQSQITTEINNRTNEDSNLQSQIYAEVTNRTNADNNLQSQITTEVTNRSNAINNLQAALTELASGSPLVASSTSEMEDTTHIYVNTTDGKWYYYDGSDWVIGGTYQATEVGEGSIGYENLDSDLQDIIGISVPTFTYTNDYFIKYTGEIIATSNYCYTSPIELKANQTIRTIARGSGNNVSMITTCDENGDNLNPVVISIDNDAHEYKYKTTEDTYVILSGRKNYINEVFIIDDKDEMTKSIINEQVQNSYDYTKLLNNNSPIIYGGTTFNDYSKNMEQGYFNNGEPSSSTIRIRSINFVSINYKTKLLNLLNNSSYRIFTYETDDTYVGTTEWITDKIYEFNFTNNKKYKFAFKFNDDSTITPEDLINKFFILSGQEDLKHSLENTLNLGTSTYPSYWDTEINNKVDDINELIKSYVSNNDEIATFFVIADPHYPNHNYVTSKLIKYLSKNCGINLSICLGDLIQDSTEGHAQNLLNIQDAMTELLEGTDRLLLTQGNHDNGAGIPDSSGHYKFERVIHDNEWIHHTSSKLLNTPKIVFDELGKAFYYDDMINKIRFISLDSFEDKSYTVDVEGNITSSYLGSCTNRQVAWLRDVALSNIPEGYSVITFSHKPLYHPEIENTEILNAELTINASSVMSVLNNFITNGGNYIAHFSGHQHHDFLDNLNNIPQVIDLNDGKHFRSKTYWGSQADLVGDSPLKISGTTNECAFDVVIINKTTKHMDLIRIGAGSDRELNY